MRLAEEIPEGVTTQDLISLAGRYDIVVLAGVLEREGEKIFNSYVAVDSEGVLSRFRKIHPFISSYMSPGNEYVVFDLRSEEHTSELQSRGHLVCRLLLEKKK